MIILAIETSCDDTCIALVRVREKSGRKMPRFLILSNVVSSQTKIHEKYGGVVPSLAKRAHQENLVPVLEKAIENAKTQMSNVKSIPNSKTQILESILERESELLEQFSKTVIRMSKPKLDLIAVTHGPGLEPALWTGVNFARALSYWWEIPLLGVDHMEGHIAANFLAEVGGISNASAKGVLPRRIRLGRRRASGGKFPISKHKIEPIKFPALCLAVSGGHTQLILAKDILKYKLLGETVDDAAGEGFDKVARLLGLGFPGGPEIAKAAKGGDSKAFDFPRPMIRSSDYNFSFSGLKTAVLYTLKKILGIPINELGDLDAEKLSPKTKRDIAASFQQGVVDVLIVKTIRAAKEYGAKTILLAGGVAANDELRRQLGEKIETEIPNTAYQIPDTGLATDNAAMIAAAGYFHRKEATLGTWKTLEANGSKRIG